MALEKREGLGEGGGGVGESKGGRGACQHHVKAAATSRARCDGAYNYASTGCCCSGGCYRQAEGALLRARTDDCARLQQQPWQ